MTEIYDQNSLSPDSQALVLLCTSLTLSSGSDLSPLTLREWSELSPRVFASTIASPGNLFGMTAEQINNALEVGESKAERISRLLERRGQLALALSRLYDSGIWIKTLIDSSYPSRLKGKLGSRSPIVIFGVGKISLTERDGIAIVGSRDVSPTGEIFARRLGESCAAQDLSVVSGAARGVDRIAMTACLECGGVSVGVLADSLERVIMEREVRQALDDKRLCLFTPSLPSAPFHVGNAMSRNKSIYALARYAVVVDSSNGKGGTWEGALENLKRQWTPLFVRSGDDTAPGNSELIRKGGIALTAEEIVGKCDLMAILEPKTSLTDSDKQESTKKGNDNLDLFGAS